MVVAQHVIQRGNNGQVCFARKQDFATYISWLKDYSKEYEVDIHTQVLMSNQTHILCAPQCVDGINNMVQSLER
jgi:putative transposase